MPTEFWIYACTLTPRKQVLVSLLEKAVEREMPTVVFCQNEQEAEALNEYLWSFDAEKFIPHGTLADGEAEHQPIFLTHEALVPNAAELALVWGEARVPTNIPFKRVVVMVDARFEPAKLTPAQEALKNALGAVETLWVQTDTGKWVKQ